MKQLSISETELTGLVQELQEYKDVCCQQKQQIALLEEEVSLAHLSVESELHVIHLLFERLNTLEKVKPTVPTKEFPHAYGFTKPKAH